MKQIAQFVTTVTGQLIFGLILGVAVGLIWPSTAVAFRILADLFVKLIKMVAGLIVFLTVIGGFVGKQRPAAFGRLAAYSIICFEVMSTLALLLGMVLANLFTPGRGFPIWHVAGVYSSPSKHPSIVDFLINIVPDTAVSALASGQMLQIFFVALIFGYAMYWIGEPANPLIELVHSALAVTFRVVSLITRVAPIAVFGAVAFMTAGLGIAALIPLLELVALVFSGCLTLIIAIFWPMSVMFRFNLLSLIKLLKEELIICFSTTSSEAALPGVISKLTSAGIDPSIVGFVVPSGYVLNLCGTSLYVTLTAMFIAQASNVHLSISDQVELVALFLVTSKGMASISGGALIIIASTLLVFPQIPLTGLAVVVGVDRLMDAARAATNVIGNAVATVSIARIVRSRQNPELIDQEIRF